MDYRLFIARRYLTSSKRVSLISILTGISVTGIAVGVTLLVTVLSVLNGFYEVVRDLLLTFDPHLRIVSAEQRGFQPSDSLTRTLRSQPEVQELTPYVEGKALLTFASAQENSQVVVVRGIDSLTLDLQGFGPGQKVVRGSTELGVEDGVPGILIGRGMGTRMNLLPEYQDNRGSRVGLLSAADVDQMLGGPMRGPPVTDFEVRGFYELTSVYDRKHVFVGIEQAKDLFGMGDRISGIDVRLENPDQARALKSRLLPEVDTSRYTIQTWYDIQQSLYSVMRLEKWGASIILTLIVIVAAFNIVGSLTMVVIEKRRDLAVLQAIGVSRKNIRRIFLLEGGLIGGVGSAAGLSLGLVLVYVQKYTGMVPMAGAQSFIIDAYPVHVEWLDLVIVVGVALLLSMLAAIYPAARAAAVPPAQAVHEDR